MKLSTWLVVLVERGIIQLKDVKEAQRLLNEPEPEKPDAAGRKRK